MTSSGGKSRRYYRVRSCEYPARSTSGYPTSSACKTRLLLHADIWVRIFLVRLRDPEQNVAMRQWLWLDAPARMRWRAPRKVSISEED